MANNPLELIKIKKEKILENEKDIALLYEELARCVSEISKTKDLNYCEQLLTSFLLANDEYLKYKIKLNNYINVEINLDSLEKDIREVSRKIRENETQLKQILLKIGAASYEAYYSNRLPLNVMNLLSVKFEEKQKKIKALEIKYNKSKSKIYKNLIQKNLNSKRVNLLETFYESAILLESQSLIDSIPMIDKDLILKSYSELKQLQSELFSSLNTYKLDKENLKKDDYSDSKVKLDELKMLLKQSEESSIKAAILLGSELYKELPDNITSNEIGVTSIESIDQITLHKRAIDKLNNDIKLLTNQLKIEEIKSQIYIENSNIKRLELQIDTCNEKIEAIESSISEKKNQIDSLVLEGVYSDE